MPNIKLLTFTSLYPNNEQPTHGIFVENRLRHLLDSGQVESKVVAPVPWFPFSGSHFGSYGKYAKIPKHERRHGIDIVHPRYPVIPKMGMTVAPFFMALALLPVLRTILKSSPFDIIDAHYFYPDGVAAVALGKMLNKPVVVTARGTDLNLIPQYLFPRRMIRWAADNASAIITVCQALKDTLVAMGVGEKKITPLRNGVDLALFQPPVDRAKLRHELGIQGPALLSVGHLVKRKGHDVVIRALAFLPETTLFIAGGGEEDVNLRNLAAQLGVAERVNFLGAIPHDALAKYYGVADVLVLASDREGWANVLLESMACGTAVVASNIWGTPEVVRSPEAGTLVNSITPEDFSRCIRKILTNPPKREETRRYAETFSWNDTTQGQIDVFHSLLMHS